MQRVSRAYQAVMTRYSIVMTHRHDTCEQVTDPCKTSHVTHMTRSRPFAPALTREKRGSALFNGTHICHVVLLQCVAVCYSVLQ